MARPPLEVPLQPREPNFADPTRAKQNQPVAPRERLAPVVRVVRGGSWLIAPRCLRCTDEADAGVHCQAMVMTHTHSCDKCKRANPISFTVEPEEAWKIVVLNRWRKLCPSCFDTEAERAGVRYTFANLEGRSWSDRPPPRNPYKRKK